MRTENFEEIQDAAMQDIVQEPVVKDMSRRDFLRFTGLAALTAVTGGCAATVYAEDAQVDEVAYAAPATDVEAEMLAPVSEAIYSATGNSWMTIPLETVNAVAGQMDNPTEQELAAAIASLLSVAERDGGNSVFNISENLISLGRNNVDSNFGNINIGQVVRIGDRDNSALLESGVICQTSHLGGIQICSNNGTTLNIMVQSKDGPVPLIKNSMNISAATLQLLKFGRYGQAATAMAKAYLQGL